jgi:pseudouridine-5'-phosphate glycosidase
VNDPGLLRLSDEVSSALAAGQPVVALETTIIAHGLPRPMNLSVARDLEVRLRAQGVVPATVGVLAGVPTVGLDGTGLEVMATSEAVAKASVRDLPVAVASGAHAATTVAATAYLARRAGVRVFATGGLGGVHRDASDTFDESADLHVLARTPITVVCAGAKSILDVGATLERMETLGITLVGYRSDHFAGFYLHDSGFPVPWRVEGPAQVATAMAAADRMGLDGAIVVSNPLPAGEQLDPELYHQSLEEALEDARRQGKVGKEVTPFLLDRIQQATGGASLEANVGAVSRNVELAAGIARAWAERAR